MKLVFHAREKRPLGQLRTYYHPSKDRSNRRLLVFLVLLCTVGLLFLVRGLYSFFVVRNVSCQMSEGPCQDEDQKLTEPFKGRLIFGTFSLHSPGKTYAIKKQFPRTLQVIVSNIPMKYLVFIDEAKEQKVAISNDGVVYTDAQKTDQISASDSAILIDGTLATNEQSVSAEKLAIYEKLSEFAKKNGADLVHIKSREEIRLHLKPDLTAIVSSESIDSELHSLQLILSSPTIEQKPALVDLRFDHPVLRYL